MISGELPSPRSSLVGAEPDTSAYALIDHPVAWCDLQGRLLGANTAFAAAVGALGGTGAGSGRTDGPGLPTGPSTSTQAGDAGAPPLARLTGQALGLLLGDLALAEALASGHGMAAQPLRGRALDGRPLGGWVAVRVTGGLQLVTLQAPPALVAGVADATHTALAAGTPGPVAVPAHPATASPAAHAAATAPAQPGAAPLTAVATAGSRAAAPPTPAPRPAIATSPIARIGSTTGAVLAPRATPGRAAPERRDDPATRVGGDTLPGPVPVPPVAAALPVLPPVDQIASTLQQGQQVMVALQSAHQALAQAGAEVERLNQLLGLVQGLARVGVWQRDLRTLQGHWDGVLWGLFNQPAHDGAPDFERVLQRVHPEDRAALRQAVLGSRQQTGRYSQRFRVQTAIDQWRHLHLAWEVQPDAQGRPARAVGIAQDESELMSAVQSVDQAHAQLRLAVDLAGLMVWQLDSAAMRLHTSEPGWALLGLPPRPEGMPLTELSELLHPEDLQCLLQIDDPPGVPQDLTLRLRHPQQVRQPDAPWRVLLTRRVARVDAQGRLLSHVGVALDITERHQSEQRLHEAAERAALAARGAGIATWESEPGSTTAWWDEQMFRLRGRDARATPMLISQALAWLHPDDRPALRRQMEEDVRSEIVSNIEFRVVWPDGSVRWLASRSAPLRDAHGRMLRRIGINWDITEGRAHAAARQDKLLAQRESLAKSRFLARMSHELRTPLHAVLGFVQLMLTEEDSPLQPDARERMELVQRSGEHLLAVINDAMELSSLESGELPLRLQPVAWSELAVSAWALLEPQSRPRAISLHHQLPADCWVQADPVRLRQVMLNLLSNAIKYNRDGGRVLLEARRVGGQWCLAVSDTGQGMTEQQLGHLFEPFNRLGQEAGEIAGTGIGLAIVRAALQRMGGEVSASSQPGRGSRFELRLPACAAEAGTHDDTAPAAGSSALPAGPVGRSQAIELGRDGLPSLFDEADDLLPLPQVTEISLEAGAGGLGLARDGGRADDAPADGRDPVYPLTEPMLPPEFADTPLPATLPPRSAQPAPIPFPTVEPDFSALPDVDALGWELLDSELSPVLLPESLRLGFDSAPVPLPALDSAFAREIGDWAEIDTDRIGLQAVDTPPAPTPAARFVTPTPRTPVAAGTGYDIGTARATTHPTGQAATRPDDRADAPTASASSLPEPLPPETGDARTPATAPAQDTPRPATAGRSDAPTAGRTAPSAESAGESWPDLLSALSADPDAAGPARAADPAASASAASAAPPSPDAPASGPAPTPRPTEPPVATAVGSQAGTPIDTAADEAAPAPASDRPLPHAAHAVRTAPEAPTRSAAGTALAADAAATPDSPATATPTDAAPALKADARPAPGRTVFRPSDWPDLTLAAAAASRGLSADARAHPYAGGVLNASRTRDALLAAEPPAAQAAAPTMPAVFDMRPISRPAADTPSATGGAPQRRHEIPRLDDAVDLRLDGLATHADTPPGAPVRPAAATPTGTPASVAGIDGPSAAGITSGITAGTPAAGAPVPDRSTGTIDRPVAHPATLGATPRLPDPAAPTTARPAAPGSTDATATATAGPAAHGPAAALVAPERPGEAGAAPSPTAPSVAGTGANASPRPDGEAQDPAQDETEAQASARIAEVLRLHLASAGPAPEVDGLRATAAWPAPVHAPELASASLPEPVAVTTRTEAVRADASPSAEAQGRHEVPAAAVRGRGRGLPARERESLPTLPEPSSRWLDSSMPSELIAATGATAGAARLADEERQPSYTATMPAVFERMLPWAPSSDGLPPDHAPALLDLTLPAGDEPAAPVHPIGTSGRTTTGDRALHAPTSPHHAEADAGADTAAGSGKTTAPTGIDAPTTATPQTVTRSATSGSTVASGRAPTLADAGAVAHGTCAPDLAPATEQADTPPHAPGVEPTAPRSRTPRTDGSTAAEARTGTDETPSTARHPRAEAEPTPARGVEAEARWQERLARRPLLRAALALTRLHHQGRTPAAATDIAPAAPSAVTASANARASTGVAVPAPPRPGTETPAPLRATASPAAPAVTTAGPVAERRTNGQPPLAPRVPAPPPRDSAPAPAPPGTGVRNPMPNGSPHVGGRTAPAAATTGTVAPAPAARPRVDAGRSLPSAEPARPIAAARPPAAPVAAAATTGRPAATVTAATAAATTATAATTPTVPTARPADAHRAPTRLPAPPGSVAATAASATPARPAPLPSVAPIATPGGPTLTPASSRDATPSARTPSAEADVTVTVPSAGRAANATSAAAVTPTRTTPPSMATPSSASATQDLRATTATSAAPVAAADRPGTTTPRTDLPLSRPSATGAATPATNSSTPTSVSVSDTGAAGQPSAAVRAPAAPTRAPTPSPAMSSPAQPAEVRTGAQAQPKPADAARPPGSEFSLRAAAARAAAEALLQPQTRGAARSEPARPVGATPPTHGTARPTTEIAAAAIPPAADASAAANSTTAAPASATASEPATAASARPAQAASALPPLREDDTIADLPGLVSLLAPPAPPPATPERAAPPTTMSAASGASGAVRPRAVAAAPATSATGLADAAPSASTASSASAPSATTAPARVPQVGRSSAPARATAPMPPSRAGLDSAPTSVGAAGTASPHPAPGARTPGDDFADTVGQLPAVAAVTPASAVPASAPPQAAQGRGATATPPKAVTPASDAPTAGRDVGTSTSAGAGAGTSASTGTVAGVDRRPSPGTATAPTSETGRAQTATPASAPVAPRPLPAPVPTPVHKAVLVDRTTQGRMLQALAERAGAAIGGMRTATTAEPDSRVTDPATGSASTRPAPSGTHGLQAPAQPVQMQAGPEGTTTVAATRASAITRPVASATSDGSPIAPVDGLEPAAARPQEAHAGAQARSVPAATAPLDDAARRTAAHEPAVARSEAAPAAAVTAAAAGPAPASPAPTTAAVGLWSGATRLHLPSVGLSWGGPIALGPRSAATAAARIAPTPQAETASSAAVSQAGLGDTAAGAAQPAPQPAPAVAHASPIGDLAPRPTVSPSPAMPQPPSAAAWVSAAADGRGTAGSDSARLPPLAGDTVLYIEDHAVNLMIVRQMVSRRPHLKLVTAATGLEGLTQARARLPALILLDMQLPDIDGFEVLRRLRADPLTARIPCMAVSANALQTDIQRALAAGCVEYWTKPLNLQAFLGALDKRCSPPPSGGAGTPATPPAPAER